MRNTIWMKRLRLLVTTMAISFLVIVGGHLDASDFEYDIGDTGPAGGYIFYVDEADEYDWTYLEVAPVDVLVGGENPQWGAIDVTVAVPGSPYSDEREKLGSGQDNTLEIVRFFDSLKHEDTGEDYYSFAWNDQPQNKWVMFTDSDRSYRIHPSSNGTVAATLAHRFEHNGFGDWFLPSKEALNEIYENLDVNGIGGFASSYYWSSSERSFRLAWQQAFSASPDHFTDGAQMVTFKDSLCGVRPIRAF